MNTSSVKPSLLAQAYILELWLLADNIKNQCEKIFELTETKPGETFLRVSKDVHGLILVILSNAANIKKLVFTSSKKLDKETNIRFQIRMRRAKMLRDLLDGIKLEEILNSKIRNTLEHFDEYLDEADELLSIKGHPTATLALTNMVLSHWQHLADQEIFPIRIYIASEKKFYNMKWSIDVGKVYAESVALVEHLKSHPDTRLLVEAGAFGVKLR